MVLVIDNYDSFTYNIVQYLGEMQVKMEIYRNDQIALDKIQALNPERILISPGPCSPRESRSLKRNHPHIQSKNSDLGRLPWPPMHRPRVRRKCHRQLPHDARENLAD